MTDIKNELERLTAEHGVDAIQNAAASLRNSMDLKIPAHHLGVLNPKALQYSVDQLNASFDEILQAGDAREKAYQEIGELRRKSRELETEIELAESEALMNIRYDLTGKNAYGVIYSDLPEAKEFKLGEVVVAQELKPKEVLLSNDKARKAYMVAASKDIRKQKAEVDGQIAKIEAEIKRATARWETNNAAAAAAMRKADIQAALLNYLRR